MSYKDMRFGFKAEQLIGDGTVDAIAIGTIKAWLNGTKIPPLSDEQIVLFLASCEEDIEFTQRTIKMYYHIRSTSPQLFSNRSLGADDIQSALQSGNICEWRDEDGHVFIFYGFKSDSPNWNLRTTAKLMFMVTEAVIYDGPPKGLDIVIDANELSLGVVAKVFHPSLMSVIAKYFQQASPVRMRRIHVLNSSYLVCKMMQIIQPFLNGKFMKEMIYHQKGMNWEEFYERYVPKKFLPSDLGGELLSIKDLQELTLKKMANMGLYYEANELWVKNFTQSIN